MSFNAPPQILRIKRKRDQDPLQALILEDRQALRAKRSKPSSLALLAVLTPRKEAQEGFDAATQRAFHQALLFTLTRTDAAVDTEAIQSVLSEAGAGAKRKFIIPRAPEAPEAEIPNELSDMLERYLTVGGDGKRRRRRGAPSTAAAAAGPSGAAAAGPEAAAGPGEPSSDAAANAASAAAASDAAAASAGDYVYDVYQLSPHPMTSANHPSSTIGYIRFFDDADDFEVSDDDHPQLLDDEDSNAEDFYQNDYPSDEDAGAYSDTLDDVVLVQPNRADEVEEGFDYIESQDVRDGEYDDLYDHLDEVDLLDEDGFGSDDEFERHHFFDGDDENEMGVHRDRIFGRLQRMVDEADRQGRDA
jgi:hypothetical protein